MAFVRCSRAAIAVLIGVLPPALAHGVVSSSAYPNNYPPALPRRGGPPLPSLVFERVGEVPLPGPLPGAPPALIDGRIHIPAAGGVAVALPEVGAQAKLEPWPSPESEEGAPRSVSSWVPGHGGKYRFRSSLEGRIEAERRCSWCRRGWRHAWSLKIAAATLAPPLVLDHRVCFASLDDQVYCLRADNGHRLWTRDLQDRISHPLALWRGTVRAPAKGEVPARDIVVQLILVIPDGGGVLLALDPYDGSRAAVFEAPTAEDRMIPSPLVATNGLVVVARQGYVRTDASLTLLRLASPASPASTAPGAAIMSGFPRERSTGHPSPADGIGLGGR